jgi:hypothetical protein
MKLFSSWCLVFFSGALAAQTPPPSHTSPRPRYEVKRAPSRIQVDGRLDDPAWQAAQPMVLIFPWASQTGAKQKTTVRLLWDDQNLYIGYDCEDVDITAQFTERDDPTYRDDAVEAFLNPQPSQTEVYFGLEMSARAVLYDYVSIQSAKYVLKRFNLQDVQLATHIDGTLNMSGDKDKGWSLEVAIPWANFEELARRPEPGDIWTATFNRWDGVEPDRRLSMWVDPLDPSPNPHHPERFGDLVFVK